MRKSKTVIKTILVLPLVLGLFFPWFLAKQSQVLAQTATLIATVRINPLKVKITAPSSVSLGERFKVKATVKNLGDTKIKKTKVEIFLNSGLSLKGKPERKLGVILAKDSKTASWWVTAKETGSYTILVEASGIEEETDQIVTARDSQQVVVKENSASYKVRLIFFSFQVLTNSFR